MRRSAGSGGVPEDQGDPDDKSIVDERDDACGSGDGTRGCCGKV